MSEHLKLPNLHPTEYGKSIQQPGRFHTGSPVQGPKYDLIQMCLWKGIDEVQIVEWLKIHVSQVYDPEVTHVREDIPEKE